MSQRKYASAAERQKAYRNRHRNAIDSVTQIAATPSRRVTRDPRYNDVHYQFICMLEGKPFFAGVVYGPDHCDECRRKAVRS